MVIQTDLLKLGFNASRSAVYLACLELGSSTVADIAKKSGIRRTTAYRILEELVEDGLAEEDLTGPIKRFTAQPPGQLVQLLNSKKNQAEQLLPELTKLFHQTSEKPKVRFYAGLRGLKTMLEDSLTSKEKLVRSFSPLTTDLTATMGQTYTRHYIQQRIKLGVERHALRPYTQDKITSKDWEFQASDPKLKRQVRFLPERLTFRTPIQIYDDKVTIMDLDQQFGFIMKNSALANFLKQIFDMLWNVAEK
ncbi:MAG: helix-turn-helix domain-containing protein [Patescibacteria group bacterium]|jgi:sugar-specific transcriptional regulator TrmB